MLGKFLQINTLSIVLLGGFNPVIIDRYWLAHKQLIREQEAKEAVVEIIHPEIVRYSLKWVRIEITPDRIEFRTSQEPYFEVMKDLVVSIFKILPETPITLLGLNHLKYYALPDKDRYYKFGDKLSPLNIWTDCLNEPRMLGLEITDQNRKDGIPGHIRVKVSPSDITLATPYGILINVNDQMGLKAGLEGRKGEVIQLLEENWKASFDRATNIVESIWSKTVE